jgi:hypothetical protein
VKTHAAPTAELSVHPLDGSVAVGGQRDGGALLDVRSNRTRADQLRPLLRELRQR